MIPILDLIKNKQDPLKIAHRGGMGLYPENTHVGFYASVYDHGVDMLEMDLQITQDGRVVVLHDAILDRTTNGKGNVSRLRYSEIEQYDAGYYFMNNEGEFPFRDKGIKVPLFEDILENYPDTYLNLELKSNNPSIVYETAKIVEKYNAGNRIIIGSGNYFQNKRVHRVLPKCCHYLSQLDLYLFCTFGSLGMIYKYWQNFHVLETPMYYYGAPLYAYIRKVSYKMGMPILVWGANNLQQIAKLKSDGVDGIFTDYPDLL